MSDELPDTFSDDPVFDDGVITFPPIDEDSNMPAVDLPPSVAAQLLTETMGNIQANNRDARNAGSVAINVLAGSMARRFDELSALSSRSHSGLIATPIARPTTQSNPAP